MFDHVQAYYQPGSVPETLRLLRTLGPGSRVVAGATDLAVQAERSTRFLVDITRLGLSYIKPRSGGWAIGATTTMAELEQSPKIRALAGGILARAASTCGSVQLRNMATLGGNLANASPAADTATPLLVMGARVVFQGPGGKRTVALEEFFAGPARSVLRGALLLEIVIPAAKPGSGWSFQKLGRTESDIALVNAAAGLQLDRGGRCAWARIALGAVAPVPMRVPGPEMLLAGQRLDRSLLKRAAEQSMREVRPITDVRASAEYRRAMSGVLVERVLEDCARQAGCEL